MTRPDRRAVAATAVGRLTANPGEIEIALGEVERALTADDVRAIHGRLMANEPARFTPGDFRREQNWIGGRLDSPMDARFIPPPEDEVAALLEPYEERIAAAA